MTIQAQEKQQLQTNIQKLQLEKQQKQITRPVSGNNHTRCVVHVLTIVTPVTTILIMCANLFYTRRYLVYF